MAKKQGMSGICELDKNLTVPPSRHWVSMSHTTTEEKCGMDFSPLSGEVTSGEKQFPY